MTLYFSLKTPLNNLPASICQFRELLALESFTLPFKFNQNHANSVPALFVQFFCLYQESNPQTPEPQQKTLYDICVEHKIKGILSQPPLGESECTNLGFGKTISGWRWYVVGGPRTLAQRTVGVAVFVVRGAATSVKYYFIEKIEYITYIKYTCIKSLHQHTSGRWSFWPRM